MGLFWQRGMAQPGRLKLLKKLSHGFNGHLEMMSHCFAHSHFIVPFQLKTTAVVDYALSCFWIQFRVARLAHNRTFAFQTVLRATLMSRAKSLPSVMDRGTTR